MNDTLPDAVREQLSEQTGSRRSQQFFSEPGMDRFVAVILNMASEISVLEERLRKLEGSAEAGSEGASAFVERVFAPLRDAE